MNPPWGKIMGKLRQGNRRAVTLCDGSELEPPLGGICPGLRVGHRWFPVGAENGGRAEWPCHATLLQSLQAFLVGGDPVGICARQGKDGNIDLGLERLAFEQFLRCLDRLLADL